MVFKRILLALTILVIIVSSMSYHVFLPVSGGRGWSVEGLRYRAEIRVLTYGLNYSIEGLLVPLHVNSSLIDFSKTSPSGDDVVVTSIDGRVLPYYVEYWNISEDKGLIWVKLPEYNGSTSLYLYYGLMEGYNTGISAESPWRDYFLAILFNEQEIFYVKNKPYIRGDAPGRHVAKIIGPGYEIIPSPTGQAIYLDGRNAWIMLSNITFADWSSITIEALLHLYREQKVYGVHRDLTYGNYLMPPYASIYMLYSKNKTNPNITLYFNTWKPGSGKREYKVNLTKYKGEWIYLVLTFDNTTREYKVYVNGEKVYEERIPLGEKTILDINPREWGPYGSRYKVLGIGASNLGFERTRVAYDFLRIMKNKVLDEEWVKAEYSAITNTSLKLISVEENSRAMAPTGFSIPKTLVFGVALVLIVSLIYMVYKKLEARKK